MSFRKRTNQKLLELKPYLDELNNKIETPDYIHDDPVQFMHAFEKKEDKEIAGFLAALMAWGRRDIVCRKVEQLLKCMEYKPHQFVLNYEVSCSEQFRHFKHRTFKPVDIHGFICALQQIYIQYRDLEEFWSSCKKQGETENREMMAVFHERFLSLSTEIAGRTQKHISNPARNSSCKRLYMYLRWTIRRNSPVDTGIWDFISPAELMIPLDVHVARNARRYGLLARKSNDWKAVNELTEILRRLNPDDPARYDFALFGLGALDYSLPRRFILNSV